MRRHILAVLLFALSGTLHADADTGEHQVTDDSEEYQAMIDLAWKSGCFNCHDVHEQVRGPAWVEVAKRYRDDDSAFERLVVTVREGGSGNWGDDRMSANKRVSEETIRTLVEWLLQLEE